MNNEISISPASFNLKNPVRKSLQQCFSVVHLFFLAFASLFAGNVAAAKSPSLDDLLRDWKVMDARLSPNGDYLAVTLPNKEGKIILGIIPIADPKALQTVGVRGPGEMVNAFDWVSPSRIVFSVARKVGGAQLQPQPTGELWAVNADGSNLLVLNSWRGDSNIGSHLNKNTAQRTFAFVLDTLRDDDEYILMYTTPIEVGDDGAHAVLYRVNVVKGSRKRIGSGPLRNAQFLADPSGQVRVAYGVDTDNTTKIYTRSSNGAEWTLMHDQNSDGFAAYPIAFAGDDQHIYMQREYAEGPDALMRLSLEGGKPSQILRDALSDPLQYYVTADGSDLYSALFDAGVPEVTTFGDSKEANLLDMLKKQFIGSLVEIVNFSDDGNFALVSVSSSTHPGEFFRVDLTTRKLEFLISRAAWLDGNQLAAKRPVQLKARDGTPLHGYLTLPRGEGGKPAPMVIWVHGGPHGPPDRGDYDSEVQILASGGYAVLQINYRGSGGYGAAFLTAGYGRWGTQMQDDVTDATRWAIEQGIADPKRICIGGASYGGYAALMGAAREPDLYRCAISYVGVHDLRMMFTRGDIPDSSYGESYLKKALGNDMDALYRRSPVSQAGNIKAALFIAAGGMDERVPPVHAKAMKAALDEAKHQRYEYYVEPREGHGFYDLDHRRKLYDGILRFLEKHIGSR